MHIFDYLPTTNWCRLETVSRRANSIKQVALWLQKQRKQVVFRLQRERRPGSPNLQRCKLRPFSKKSVIIASAGAQNYKPIDRDWNVTLNCTSKLYIILALARDLQPVWDTRYDSALTECRGEWRLCGRKCLSLVARFVHRYTDVVGQRAHLICP